MAAVKTAARALAHPVNDLTASREHAFARPDGPIAALVCADPQYDPLSTDFLDPLELGDVYVFRDGSSLHYDYDKKCWLARSGTITSYGGTRTLRRKRGSWQQEP